LGSSFDEDGTSAWAYAVRASELAPYRRASIGAGHIRSWNQVSRARAACREIAAALGGQTVLCRPENGGALMSENGVSCGVPSVTIDT